MNSLEHKVKIGKRGKKTIEKQDLEQALSEDPEATQKNLAKRFCTTRSIISRELLRHGLCAQKKFKGAVCISEEDILDYLKDNPLAGVVELSERFGCAEPTVNLRLELYNIQLASLSERRSGENNPNYGDKDRPWLEGDNHPLRQWHKENPDFGELQKGKANPIHNVMHLYEDPEYVKRITRGIRAHTDEKKGNTYEEFYGEEKAAEYKKKLRETMPARLAKMPRSETAPERAVKEILEELGVLYKEQAIIGYYMVDFLLPDQAIVVQADGDFWHAHPDKYKDKDLYDLQKTNRWRDSACNKYLRNKDYIVIRFWESDLENNRDDCKHELVSYIGDEHVGK